MIGTDTWSSLRQFLCGAIKKFSLRTNIHLIHALNVSEDRALYMTSRPIVTQFPGHRCMDDLITERSLDSQATWVIYILGLLPLHVIYTVPTFNSCTKCLVSLGIIHDRTPDYLPVSWTWMHVRPHNWT